MSMTMLLLCSALLVPLASACFSTARLASWFAILAPLPALALALINPPTQVMSFEWLLLGVRLGLDDTGRLFLLASALVWLLAAVYAADSLRFSAQAGRFRLFFQLAMAGNFILILAQDMLSFYLGFTLMGLSATGLVIHQASDAARRAGRLYLAWTLLGEVVLFSAVILLAARSGGLAFAGLQASTPSSLAVALLLVGFGIKLALPGLHVWLPLSYSAAPAAGAAVLSGPMISAGLLGWMRFLPPGSEALVPWGTGLIVIGMIGVVFGLVIGLLQNNPKVVLGYSSISKMGVLSSGFGIALAHPQASTLLLFGLTLYAINHLLVKSALFVGLDLLERGGARPWVLSGMLLLGLILVGVPLTNGALAKVMLASSLPEVISWFGAWLAAAAVASTLLMGRLAFLLRHRQVSRPPAAGYALLAWFSLIVLLALLPLLADGGQGRLSAGLPLLGGVLLILILWRYCPPRLGVWVGRIPPGDILHPIAYAAIRLAEVFSLMLGGCAKSIQSGRRCFAESLARAIQRPRGLLAVSFGWSTAGILWISLVGLILLAMLRLD